VLNQVALKISKVFGNFTKKLGQVLVKIDSNLALASLAGCKPWRSLS
jgi:hypothetical protein